jgi:APA family basic amino acid/polyamine antiporter
MIAVLWAYEGWHFVTYSAGEVIHPQKDFPRALFSAVVFLVGVYLLANLGYLAALGPEGAGHTETIAATSVSTVVGPRAAKIVALSILISVFSAAIACCSLRHACFMPCQRTDYSSGNWPRYIPASTRRPSL